MTSPAPHPPPIPGFPRPGKTKHWRCVPGGVQVSEDGEHWTEGPGHPLLDCNIND